MKKHLTKGIFVLFCFLYIGTASSQGLELKLSSKGIELQSGLIVLDEDVQEMEGEVIEDLQESIESQNQRIQDLEKEIKRYKEDLENTQKQRVQIQGEVYELNVGANKAESEVNLVKNKIIGAELEIQSITYSISEESERINLLTNSLKELFRVFNEIDSREQIYLFLESGSILTSIKALADINEFKFETIQKIKEIKELQDKLRNNQQKVVVEKNSLLSLERELDDRKELLDIILQNKELSLNEIQKAEDERKRILEQTEEERDLILQEISSYEAELKFILDPSSVPAKSNNLLSLPFDAAVRITQKFGNTRFARISKNYRFHDGIDFGLVRGTKILSAHDGEIVGVGNTDLVSGCRLWGKWVAVDHKNGLTTLYAHLDLIKAKIGDKVKRGDLIAYSGNTGYSTGPHLHFSVYATSGFKIVPYESISNGYRCRGLLIPTTPREAKLNPFDYISL